MEIGVFAFASIVLGILIIAEIKEYQKYRKAAQSVVALGAGMDQQGKLTINHLELIENRTQQLINIVTLLQQQAIFHNTVLQIHSEALNLEGMKDAHKLQEQIMEE